MCLFRYIPPNISFNMNIKNTWEELTFNEVLQIQQIISADINDTYKASNILAVLAGVEVDVIEDLPIHKFSSLLPNIEFLHNDPPKCDHQDTYDINGHKYCLSANITDITTAQYIDYQSYMKEENPDLCKITSVFLIPDGHKYNDGYDMEQVWKDVGDMLYIDVMALAFFLRKQYALYTMITTDFLSEAMKRKKVSKKEIKQTLRPLDNMALSLLS